MLGPIGEVGRPHKFRFEAALASRAFEQMAFKYKPINDIELLDCRLLA